eukprot:jgi/Tetstr1/454264/TSEL_041183.t1
MAGGVFGAGLAALAGVDGGMVTERIRTKDPRLTSQDVANMLAARPGWSGVTSKGVRDRWNNHVLFTYRPPADEVPMWKNRVADLVGRHGKNWARIAEVLRESTGHNIGNETVKRLWISHNRKYPCDAPLIHFPGPPPWEMCGVRLLYHAGPPRAAARRDKAKGLRDPQGHQKDSWPPPGRTVHCIPEL